MNGTVARATIANTNPTTATTVVGATEAPELAMTSTVTGNEAYQLCMANPDGTCLPVMDTSELNAFQEALTTVTNFPSQDRPLSLSATYNFLAQAAQSEDTETQAALSKAVSNFAPGTNSESGHSDSEALELYSEALRSDSNLALPALRSFIAELQEIRSANQSTEQKPLATIAPKNNRRAKQNTALVAAA